MSLSRLSPIYHAMASPATYLTWIALVPVCSFAVFAQGGPPLLTDDPGTPGNRNWEINIASTQFFSPGENEIWAPLLDIKWRFYQQSDEKGWNISTYPQVEVNNPDHSQPRGLVDRGPRFLLPVEITKVFGPVELNFEGGYWWTQEPSNERILGLAVGHQFTKRFEGLSEIYDDVVLGGTARSTTFDIGGRYEFHKGLLILFMAGRRIIGSGPVNGQPSLIGYLGLQIQLSHEHKRRHAGH